VLLYRLLTGRLPYRIADPSPAGVASVIAHTQPEPSGLDAPLDAILSKALSKMPPAAIGPPRRWMRTWRAIWKDSGSARGSRAGSFGPRRPLRCFSAAGILGFGVLRAPRRPHQLIPFDAGVPNAMQPALSMTASGWRSPHLEKTGTHPDIWLKADAQRRSQARHRRRSRERRTFALARRPLAGIPFHTPPAGIYLQPSESGGAARLLVEGGRARAFRRMVSGSPI
jgi:hypothetical protein